MDGRNISKDRANAIQRVNAASRCQQFRERYRHKSGVIVNRVEYGGTTNMRLMPAIALVAAFPTFTAAQQAGQLSGEAQTYADSGLVPENQRVQAEPRREDPHMVSWRRDRAVVVATYAWPFDDFNRAYNHFAARYRNYARDYGNFAYDYRGFAPGYRDYARDYGNFAHDYLPDSLDGSYDAPETTGSLSVDILPTFAQVYVDQRYVGMSYELGGGLTLEAGPHRVEFRADDHTPVVLYVTIEPGRQVRYEGALVRQNAEPEPAPPALVRQATPAMTVYFIPGCYLGNVPPNAARLPAGCDIGATKVMTTR